jgi:hypothetical protein
LISSSFDVEWLAKRQWMQWQPAGEFQLKIGELELKQVRLNKLQVGLKQMSVNESSLSGKKKKEKRGYRVCSSGYAATDTS